MKYLVLVVLLVFGCSKTIETEGEFIERFAQAIKNDDLKAMQNCFVNSKNEIRKMTTFQEQAFGSPKVIDETIDRMYAAAQEDMPNILNKVKRKTIEDWSAVTLKKIEKTPLNNPSQEIKIPKGYRIATLTADYVSPDGPIKISFGIIDLDNGMWKLVEYPRRL